MTSPQNSIFIGRNPLRLSAKAAGGAYVTLFGEPFYKIENFDAIEPFFMSIVSSSDHWLFIASSGGISAGRGSAEQALFPYYTVDKLTENHENTGNKAILLIQREGEQAHRSLWEPLSERQQGVYDVQRNLYKNIAGTTVVFEEINFDLGLTYRYAWRTGEQFGFVKSAWLSNTGATACQVEILDGIQNILPANVSTATQNTFSCLLDAYKRSELHAETGLGIFALNSTLTDLAEPSESLLATTVAQIGLETPVSYLLSSMQLDRFRQGQGVHQEGEARGRRAAYFVHTTLDLAPGAGRGWHLYADVNQDSAAVLCKINDLGGDKIALLHALENDLAANTLNLKKIVARADGLQLSQDQSCTVHHFANVMFNVMRGGIFTDHYWVDTPNFIEFIAARNRAVLQSNPAFFAALPAKIHIADLQGRAAASGCTDLFRLSTTYLPLSFSRRHGDPSRPWNRFAIKIKKPDGTLRLDYEGNWRDIFQNWEALAGSYPEFIEGMICTFLNAATVDGYNPYRITYQGVDWEVTEPDNPWANIGYWSDHQIIYLVKLMEISARLHPGKLQSFLAQPMFSCAHVPYHIKPYTDLIQDPYNTIIFDWELERKIEERQRSLGSDGKLVHTPGGQVLHASLTEKLLTLLLAKLANFVPEGGIWMNTQRPEWNDANNALVGKGLSVVTLGYLRRYITFCKSLLQRALSAENAAEVQISAEVQQFFAQTAAILRRFQPLLQGQINDEQRRAALDALGQAGSDYRWNFYRNGLSGALATMSLAEIIAFLDLAQQYVEHSLRANRRHDALYHAYNILHLGEGRATVGHLYEMLEGQVSILSSGLLSSEESLALLESLRRSSLYQADQHSYILYPDRCVPGFLEKNCLDPLQVKEIELFARLAAAGDKSLVTVDLQGVYHFNGTMRNARDLHKALAALQSNPQYAALVAAESEKILRLFEATFKHSEFTGRSGSFFAYEGLGSIYWHMVSKLLLAAQEAALNAGQGVCAAPLRERYTDIRKGLGFNRSPAAYGAFPADPYSHTPKGQGAKQPGMTGAVKEEILTRQAELGFSIVDGRLVFDLSLFDASELLIAPAVFAYWDVAEEAQQLEAPAGALAYTICQTPVILQAADAMQLTVHYADGSMRTSPGAVLDAADSQHIFQRDGVVHHLIVSFSLA